MDLVFPVTQGSLLLVTKLAHVLKQNKKNSIVIRRITCIEVWLVKSNIEIKYVSYILSFYENFNISKLVN